MTELLQRLRERKLVQWSLAYVAAAFALLQGLDIVAQQFGWPDGVRRGITVALAIGFFVTLVLAWYHGERGAQRLSGTELLLLSVADCCGASRRTRSTTRVSLRQENWRILAMHLQRRKRATSRSRCCPFST